MSNNIVLSDGGLIEKFSPEEVEDAKFTGYKIRGLLDQIHGHELGLATNYAQLGSLLLKIRSKKYWILWGHETFGRYIESIREQVDKGRTQIYQVISVAEKLLPAVNENDLVKMGITKALELKRLVAQKGVLPSKKIISKATDPDVSVQELREEIFNVYNVKPEHAGTYLDLKGFYATAQEREEINRAFDVARKTDPVISNDIPEWARTKEIMLRLSREYLATYEYEVMHS